MKTDVWVFIVVLFCLCILDTLDSKAIGAWMVIDLRLESKS